MKRTLMLFAILLLSARLAAAAFDPAVLDRVGLNYAGVQPGLENYRVVLKTDKFETMLARMTANIPPDMPRPTVPELVKYWSRRAAGATLIRGEGTNVFPYMQEMIGRFSAEFAVDLRALFLPAAGVARRAELLRQATVQSEESKDEAGSTLTVRIAFPAPTDLGGAFYGEGLDLPQTAVTALSFDLDPQQNLVKEMEITTANAPTLHVSVVHYTVEGGWLPEQLRIRTADGSINDHFVTTFAEIAGFWLPLKQVRTIHRPGQEETISVVFAGYKLNTTFPPDVEKALSRR